MRRVLVPVVAALGVAALATGATSGPALAQAPAPAASAAAGPAVPGKKVCTLTDERLVELSGMVATADGYIVVNDSSDLASRERIFFLSKKCNVREAVAYTGNGPRDAEDLALTRDGKTLWIGDIGDNNGERGTVALWRMPADGGDSPELFRVRYPEGARDAEALLVGADGVPVIVTKGAKAELYKPGAALRKGQTVDLRKIGEVTLPRTGTSNPLGLAGRVPVTGAAVAPDGSRVVLRTYADAFEWDVNGGDVVAELTGGQPRVTPLPDEPWGEAISYSPDGASFLTVSETAQQEGLQPEILRYTPAKAAPPAPAGGAGPGGGGAADTRSFLDKLDLGDITALIGGVGLIGVLLVVAGVIGIVRARRRTAADAALLGLADDDSGRVPVGAAVGPAGRPREEATEFLARVPERPRYADGPADDGYGPRTGSVYGGGRDRAGGPPTGSVYGARPDGPARGAGNVYGGSGAGAGRGDAGGRGGGERTGNVYGGGGGYRSDRDADRYGQQDRAGYQPDRGGEYRSGNVYGGGSTARRRDDDGRPGVRYPDDERYGYDEPDRRR
jgi:hypothetical protein